MALDTAEVSLALLASRNERTGLYLEMGVESQTERNFVALA